MYDVPVWIIMVASPNRGYWHMVSFEDKWSSLAWGTWGGASATLSHGIRRELLLQGKWK